MLLSRSFQEFANNKAVIKMVCLLHDWFVYITNGSDNSQFLNPFLKSPFSISFFLFLFFKFNPASHVPVTKRKVQKIMTTCFAILHQQLKTSSFLWVFTVQVLTAVVLMGYVWTWIFCPMLATFQHFSWSHCSLCLGAPDQFFLIMTITCQRFKNLILSIEKEFDLVFTTICLSHPSPLATGQKLWRQGSIVGNWWSQWGLEHGGF